MTGERRSGVFIYGSCVSRDTFERMDPKLFELRAYVARQSLISAFSPAPAFHVARRDLSPFQRRMLEQDARGSLPAQFAGSSATTAVVLWDLADERLGVYELESGGHVTRTPELITSGTEAELAPSARLLEFGSEEHFSQWSLACVKWWELVASVRRTHSTIMLAPAWARTAVDGTPVPTSFGLSADQGNALYTPYLQFVRENCPGISFAQVDEPIADPSHRWGLAPFHYAEPTYLELNRQILSNLSDAEPTEQGLS